MSKAKFDTKSKIQDVAERFIIQGGYGNFSFRDIAEAVGIKSASVHYHYRTKGDLVATVMARYTHTFSLMLPDPHNEELDAKHLLNSFIDGFKDKIVTNGDMSLCTMLTSNKPILPEPVCDELAVFYKVKLDWVTQVLVRLEQVTEEEALIKASQLLACLHGASILVQGTNDPTFFDRALSYWKIAYV
ncbi:TetR/AcrR family transcriptional regulator [Marinomonas colpomeniae]|uniref:TetR/AcrR family transcriptional regulator n=1 Tax=Marinomonas colpomeniae TaxID=2774408 RepID=A0ABR8NYR2_9GAMM|nr:TetR/AcrR family transcriptional regulator [Marinomonas colpomeniae]MBD5770649.1 TetR/AcrR family transcriptional regulator [Marinomonas colpomeniae]